MNLLDNNFIQNPLGNEWVFCLAGDKSVNYFLQSIFRKCKCMAVKCKSVMNFWGCNKKLTIGGKIEYKFYYLHFINCLKTLKYILIKYLLFKNHTT